MKDPEKETVFYELGLVGELQETYIPPRIAALSLLSSPSSINAAIDHAIASLPPDKTAATFEAGVDQDTYRLAFAVRGRDGGWSVGLAGEYKKESQDWGAQIKLVRSW